MIRKSGNGKWKKKNEKRSTYYKQGKKQIPLMALDRWILINKPVRLPIDIAEKHKCPHCMEEKTGKIVSVSEALDVLLGVKRDVQI
jgi:hypothetical protein